MAEKSTRTVSVDFRFALSPEGKEMRIATLETHLQRQLAQLVDAFAEAGYPVDTVERADWNTKRSDGRGFREGSLLD